MYPSIVLLSVLAIFSMFTDTSALICQACDGVINARDCTQVRECGPHEACFHEQYVTVSGRILRRLGCMDTRQCSSGLTGRSSHERSSDIIVCSTCCHSNLCQTKLCSDIDFVGHVCYNCDFQLQTDSCDRITECGRDEVCRLHYANSQHTFSSGCMGKHACDNLKANLIGRKRQLNSCFNCCSGDLCNDNCTLPTTTVIPPTTTSHATCIDSTPEATCKLAAAIVCSDRVHAMNANCLHYCGYC